MLSAIQKCLAVALGAGAVVISAGAALAAGPQVGYVTLLAAGLPDPNGKVPTFNGVPGAGVGNVDIASPTVFLQHGTSYLYVIISQNNTYTGTCSDSYTLTQGTTVIDSGTINGGYGCGAGQYWALANLGHPVPNLPGPAVLEGTVKFGKKAITIKTPVLIQ